MLRYRGELLTREVKIVEISWNGCCSYEAGLKYGTIDIITKSRGQYKNVHHFKLIGIIWIGKEGFGNCNK